MTISMTLPARRLGTLPWKERLMVRSVTSVGLLLSRLRPDRLRFIFDHAAASARPADRTLAEHYYDAVIVANPKCAGWKGCLPRSISIALLCRLHGQWPTWCTGVRVTPPFAAHAWVEAAGNIVGEPGTPKDYRPLIRVEARA